MPAPFFACALIAFTGGNYADRVLFRSQREFVPQDILPAVR